LPLLLAIVLAAIVLMLRPGAPEPAAQPRQTSPENVATAAVAQKVFLTINFGDGRPLVNEVARWREEMTVADLLNSEPRISLTSTGSGASAAFLTSLNGVANEGADGRNWTYTVNGKHADRSFAVYELEPNDHVLWTFATPQ
jgi:hypothetical protein